MPAKLKSFGIWNRWVIGKKGTGFELRSVSAAETPVLPEFNRRITKDIAPGTLRGHIESAMNDAKMGKVVDYIFTPIARNGRRIDSDTLGTLTQLMKEEDGAKMLKWAMTQDNVATAVTRAMKGEYKGWSWWMGGKLGHALHYASAPVMDEVIENLRHFDAVTAGFAPGDEATNATELARQLGLALDSGRVTGNALRSRIEEMARGRPVPEVFRRAEEAAAAPPGAAAAGRPLAPGAPLHAEIGEEEFKDHIHTAVQRLLAEGTERQRALGDENTPLNVAQAGRRVEQLKDHIVKGTRNLAEFLDEKGLEQQHLISLVDIARAAPDYKTFVTQAKEYLELAGFSWDAFKDNFKSKDLPGIDPAAAGQFTIHGTPNVALESKHLYDLGKHENWSEGQHLYTLAKLKEKLVALDPSKKAKEHKKMFAWLGGRIALPEE